MLGLIKHLFHCLVCVFSLFIYLIVIKRHILIICALVIIFYLLYLFSGRIFIKHLTYIITTLFFVPAYFIKAFFLRAFIALSTVLSFKPQIVLIAGNLNPGFLAIASYTIF